MPWTSKGGRLVFLLWSYGALGQDASLTPGVTRALSTKQICSTSWGTDHRFVTEAMKLQVFHNYGLRDDRDSSKGCNLDQFGRRYEIDHLIPRSLAGADNVKNLWPQCYSGPWNATLKDRLELRLSRDFCLHKIPLLNAQNLFRNWRQSYTNYFGAPR